MVKKPKRKRHFWVKLAIVALCIFILGGVCAGMLYLHWDRSKAFSYPSSFDCGFGVVSRMKINSFAAAYEKGQTASIKILTTNGQSAAFGWLATCHDLTTENKKIYMAEYSYADTQGPPYTITQSTCSLTFNASHTPIAHCSNGDNFALSSY